MAPIDNIKAFLAASKHHGAVYFRPTNLLLVIRYDSKPHVTTGRFDVPYDDIDKVNALTKCRVLFDREHVKK